MPQSHHNPAKSDHSRHEADSWRGKPDITSHVIMGSGITNAVPLSTYTYKLEIDSDPSAGIAFSIGFDPINSQSFFDHSFGNNGTAESAGVEAANASTYASYVASYNVAQNSWASHWFDAGFKPNIDGTYDFALTAGDPQGVQVAKTGMQVIVGQGGSRVPDAGSTLALLGFGVLGLGSIARRFNS